MSEHETTAVMEVKGVRWASSKAVAEAALSRRPGVLRVEANPVSQTANVTYDPARTSIKDLTGWVRECGFHCAGQSVPDHVCDPLQEDGTVGGQAGHRGTGDRPGSGLDLADHGTGVVKASPAPAHAEGTHGDTPARPGQDAPAGHGQHGVRDAEV